jgi:hypothetical protein
MLCSDNRTVVKTQKKALGMPGLENLSIIVTIALFSFVELHFLFVFVQKLGYLLHFTLLAK